MNRRRLLAHASAVALSGSLARAQPLPVISDTVPPRIDAWPLSSAGAPPLNLDFMSNPGTLDPRLTFTRGSTATYFDATGTMQTVSGNTPRWDYDPVTHALRGLLIEEQRINLLLNSATLGTQGVAVTAQVYTLSFYGTGTVTMSGAFAGSLVGTGAFPARVQVSFTPAAGTLTCTVTGSVLSAQLEAGAFPTSYIPTSAAAVTRSVDSCTISSANMGWFVSPGGSWMAEFIYNAINTRVVFIPPGTGSLSPLLISGTNTGGQYDTTFIQTVNIATPRVVTKLATTYAGAVGSVCLNGGAVASAAMSSGYGLAATNGVAIFCAATGAGDNVSGYIRRVRYWPRVLSNFEMQSVTT